MQLTKRQFTNTQLEAAAFLKNGGLKLPKNGGPAKRVIRRLQRRAGLGPTYPRKRGVLSAWSNFARLLTRRCALVLGRPDLLQPFAQLGRGTQFRRRCDQR